MAEESLLESYRLLLAEFIANPMEPCFHEGTDEAAADLIKLNWDVSERLQQLQDQYMKKWQEEISEK